MRPGQNKRMRGRNNNNNGGRKGPNPLTRSYESNGPDVKIRGTAQHVGEKYLQLARDAQTSGDPVAAESYLQHAEHYFRLIAAAQQAQSQAQAGYVRQDGDTDESDDDDDLSVPDRFASPSERLQPPMQPPPLAPQPSQPYGDRQPHQGVAERSEGQDRPYRQDRFGSDRDQRNYGDRQAQPNPDRQQERGNYDRPPERGNYDRGQERGNYDRSARNDRPDRAGGERNDRQDRNPNRNRFNREGQDYRDMQFREQPRIAPVSRDPSPEQRPQPPAPQPLDAGQELPAFITAPVRVPASAEPEHEVAPAPEPIDAATDDTSSEQLALRPRRRRRARIVTASDNGSADTPSSDMPPEG